MNLVSVVYADIMVVKRLVFNRKEELNVHLVWGYALFQVDGVQAFVNFLLNR